MFDIEDESIKNTQKHLLFLVQQKYINLDHRQEQLLQAFKQKYQKMGLPHNIYKELVKDATKLILFC